MRPPFLRFLQRLPHVAVCLALTGLPLLAESTAVPPTFAADPATILNVRDFGAIGDGRVHPVREWIDSGRFASLRELRRTHPFVDTPDWSIDEVAFEAAKRALSDTGGTIHFPAGHYVAARRPWQIWRDHVRLTGDGAERTTLSTAPHLADGLSVAPYRHVGWREGAEREFPYPPAEGARGTDTLTLAEAEWSREFAPGDLVFIRNGANRYDQDYGEFNEVRRIDPTGRLHFRHAFARDYTAARFNWAGETTAAFILPAPGRSVTVRLRRDEGFFVPPARATITVGGNLFRVERVDPTKQGREVVVRLFNPGRGNAPKGTVIAAGATVGKSRTVLRLTRSVRGFRCENLRIVGHRKALVLSNSYDSVFTDCLFERDLRDGGFRGGLTIDGDGGRFARFERCQVVARPAVGMQFARSFGNVVFADCTFTDTNVAFTEFNFDSEVTRSTFAVAGGPGLASAIIAGRSCGNLRFADNRLRVANVPAVFDTHSDIHSQRHDSEGGVVVRDNVIEMEHVPRLFSQPPLDRLVVEGNRVSRR